MSTSVELIIIVLTVLSYGISPALLIWGWIRWSKQSKSKSALATLSMIGFVLATASAVLALGSMAYAQIHHFPYYDPLLLRIFRSGMLLSLIGILFGVGGVWRQNPLRCHAPVCAVGTLAFWILAAEGE